MTKVIGIRFRNNGKVYYFDPKDFPLRNGRQVIVETARGLECGTVVLSPREVADEHVTQPLRPVIRMATEEDLERERVNREKEKEAFLICRQKIRERGLDMKLIRAEFTFDNKKVLFYFTADGRVDFRELVKDLASVFKTRIELRQIGVRDETKLLGGIGICGRPLCCSTFLSDFSSVSIKMAKEQNLSLNPTKISGTCGRLMCCLKNEQETYEYLNKRLPGVGDIVAIQGRETVGEVQTVNVLRQTARILIEEDDDKEIEEFPADQLEVVMTRRKKNKERAKERERERERLRAEKEQTALEAEAAGNGLEGRSREKSREKSAAQMRERGEKKDRTDGAADPAQASGERSVQEAGSTEKRGRSERGEARYERSAGASEKNEKREGRPEKGGRRAEKTERKENRPERNAAKADRNENRPERNSVKAERNESRSERNSAKADRNENRQEKNAAKAERNEDRPERNAAKAERGEDRSERNAAKAERGEDRPERNAVRTERNEDRPENDAGERHGRRRHRVRRKRELDE